MIHRAIQGLIVTVVLIGGTALGQVPQPIAPASQPPPPPVAPGQQLDNSRYYQNSGGQTIHSPANTLDHSVPTGATARCGDGTYSFSQHHSGTCSHHGGVAAWL